MYSNIMEIKFPNKSDNERFARSVAAAFVLELDPTVDQISEIKTDCFGGSYKCDNSRL